jgi:CRP-like cAMP-binding protein
VEKRLLPRKAGLAWKTKVAGYRVAINPIIIALILWSLQPLSGKYPMDDAFPADHDENNPSRPYQALGLHNYGYGQEIVKEGEASSCFYVILSGKVKISKRGKLVRVVEDQDVFGLESILIDQPVPYTAKAMSRSRIASYGPEALDHFIRENPRMTQSILTSTLEQLVRTTDNLVQEAPAFGLDEVPVEFYSDGAVVVTEGAPETDLFRLVSTEGGLIVTTAGAEVARIEKPGEFFGEIAGLLNLPRQATVTSIGKSVVERYGFDDFEVIIRDYPEVALQIMKTLVTRMLELTRKYTKI